VLSGTAVPRQSGDAYVNAYSSGMVTHAKLVELTGTALITLFQDMPFMKEMPILNLIFKLFA
jgi:hypothetical protein